MARSVRELREESERSRAELAATVDQLKARMNDTAGDIRNMASPQHIKSEVSALIGQKTQGWVETLKERAASNPMQTVAACTAVAVPLLRMARGFPLPLLMIGAGLALTSKTARDSASNAAAPALDSAEEIMNEAGQRAQSVRSDVEDAISSARSQVNVATDNVKQTVTDIAQEVRNRASQANDTITSTVRDGLDAAKDALGRARSTAKDTAAGASDAASAAPARAKQVIGENAALIGGLGLAIGAIVAAALPSTRAEAKLMGEASDKVKQAAGETAQSGFEAARDAAMSAADSAADSVSNADLGGHASRMTKNMADTLKEVADDVVTTAFNPSSTPNPER
jgi:hypothetical protein